MSAYKDRGFIAQLKTEGPFQAGDGLIFGVAKGLAEHYGWRVWLVRLLIVISAICLFFWPTIVLYIAAALVMSQAPEEKLKSPGERDIWLQAQLDPEAALSGLARRTGQAERRMRRLEDYVTSKEFSWNRRLNSTR